MQRIALGIALWTALFASLATAQETKTFRYDPLGRLTGVSTASSTSNLTDYQYDPADNRANRNVNAVAARAASNALQGGESIVPSQLISSLDARFQLLFQQDGNVVLYFSGAALWATGTSTGEALQFTMQSDGNLVLYTSASAPLWASGTSGHPGAKLFVQNDGNLVILDGATPIWSSGTCCH